MSKLVPNPEYANAPFQLQYMDSDGNWMSMGPPRRTNKIPPHFKAHHELLSWFLGNEVPSHILVED